MADRSKHETLVEISIPQATAAELMGKQSVRATFKLSAGCIEAISIVATQLGIKQKSLFDHLVEDPQVLSSIARGIDTESIIRPHRIQKTYVISRRSLYSLEKISKSYNAPRDALIEYSVQRLLPIILKEREKHRRRKKLLVGLRNHMLEGRKLLGKLHEQLGEQDPLFEKMAAAMGLYESTQHQMEDIVKRGEILEQFEPETLGDPESQATD
jgi:hypothetical protein